MRARPLAVIPFALPMMGAARPEPLSLAGS